jgi:predicted SAM-dependent methyltransferase
LSETTNCRDRLAGYCRGYGVDVGYGGDPITPQAITVDLPLPYTNVGNHPLNLGGDARDLYWFKDGVLDFVFSSHLLEDFEDTEAVLREWLRVLKPGGHLILFCPVEQVYREHCAKTGQSYNLAHKIADFSLVYVKQILVDRIGNVEMVHENPLVDTYSFELVARKPSMPHREKRSSVLDQSEAGAETSQTRQGEMNAVMADLQQRLLDDGARLSELEDQLASIRGSFSWRVVSRVRRVFDSIFPEGTGRRRRAESALTAIAGPKQPRRRDSGPLNGSDDTQGAT